MDEFLLFYTITCQRQKAKEVNTLKLWHIPQLQQRDGRFMSVWQMVKFLWFYKEKMTRMDAVLNKRISLHKTDNPENSIDVKSKRWFWTFSIQRIACNVHSFSLGRGTTDCLCCTQLLPSLNPLTNSSLYVNTMHIIVLHSTIWNKLLKWRTQSSSWDTGGSRPAT